MILVGKKTKIGLFSHLMWNPIYIYKKKTVKLGKITEELIVVLSKPVI